MKRLALLLIALPAFAQAPEPSSSLHVAHVATIEQVARIDLANWVLIGGDAISDNAAMEQCESNWLLLRFGDDVLLDLAVYAHAKGSEVTAFISPNYYGACELVAMRIH